MTNEENWAAQERLRAIERAVWWRGWVKRKNIVEIFGVSMAQASSDLQRYMELNPEAMAYHLSHKRYEKSPNMTCVMHKPEFGDAVRCFLSAQHLGNILPKSDQMHPQVATVELPSRRGNMEIQRAVMQSMLNDEPIKIKYWSLSSGKTEWRTIWLVGLGHDGYRWHARAWCYTREDFRDFVISRISASKKVEDSNVKPEARDEDWLKIDTIKLKPNDTLTDNEMRAIELDYGIRKNGALTLKVRRAMREYLLAHMRVSSLDLKNHFSVYD